MLGKPSASIGTCTRRTQSDVGNICHPSCVFCQGNCVIVCCRYPGGPPPSAARVCTAVRCAVRYRRAAHRRAPHQVGSPAAQLPASPCGCRAVSASNRSGAAAPTKESSGNVDSGNPTTVSVSAGPAGRPRRRGGGLAVPRRRWMDSRGWPPPPSAAIQMTLPSRQRRRWDQQCTVSLPYKQCAEPITPWLQRTPLTCPYQDTLSI